MAHVAPPGGWTHEPVHPDKWADQMLKAWKAATYHKGISLAKRELSLTDIDKAEPGELVNTPRSLQACLLLGIDPKEIQYRDFAHFTERGLSKKIQAIKFQHYEKERKEKVDRLIKERNKLIAEHDTGSIFIADGQIMGSAATIGGEVKKPSDSATKALKVAEVAKKRVEKEREKKKIAELATKKMQEDALRIAALQMKKEADHKAEKNKKDKDFALQQAANEARRRAKDEELEKEAAALAAKQYAEELKLQKERAITAKKAKKSALAAAKEKAKKQAAFQKELKIMQEKVLQQAIQKNKELAAKDYERKRLQAIKAEEIKKINAIARAEAKKRQVVALQAYYDALQKKRDDFDAKNAALAVRRAEKQVEIDKQIREKIMMEEKKEKDRVQTLEQAYARREKRIQDILKKSNLKAKLLKVYLVRQEEERQRRNVQINLEYTKAQNIVNQTTRKQALRRRQLLSHIEKATSRIRDLMETRLKIQKQRQLSEAKMMWAKGRE